MTEVQYLREIENLEAQNRKLKESLTACKLEVNKLRAALREISGDNWFFIEDIKNYACAALEDK